MVLPVPGGPWISVKRRVEDNSSEVTAHTQVCAADDCRDVHLEVTPRGSPNRQKKTRKKKKKTTKKNKNKHNKDLEASSANRSEVAVVSSCSVPGQTEEWSMAGSTHLFIQKGPVWLLSTTIVFAPNSKTLCQPAFKECL